MSDDNTVRLCVDLDTLLDVRLATAFSINPDILRLLFKNDYHSRPIDDWELLTDGLIDNETFQLAYRDRDKEILKECLPTNMLLFLNEVCKDLTQQQFSTPYVEDIIIEVNVWPYDFTSDEKKVLSAMVGHYVGEHITVTTIKKTHEYFTPTLLRENYTCVVSYSFDDWFRCHHLALEEYGCPRVTFFAPSLFLHEIPDPDELKTELSDFVTQDPFRLLEMSLVSKINLQYLTSWYFSAITGNTKK